LISPKSSPALSPWKARARLTPSRLLSLFPSSSRIGAEIQGKGLEGEDAQEWRESRGKGGSVSPRHVSSPSTCRLLSFPPFSPCVSAPLPCLPPSPPPQTYAWSDVPWRDW
jgi:hypothetical protein